jgi:ATP-dependent helicase HrpA
LRDDARDVLADALIAGETPHPDQGRVRRAVEALDELWRRSGGTLAAAAPASVRALVRAQLERVGSWDDFLRTRIVMDPAGLVDAATRERLEALPAMVRLRGDAVPVDYELADGTGVARVRLREGQARRLRTDELPPLDRPLRFAVVRGRHAPVLADTLPELQAELKGAPRSPRHERDGEHPRRPRRGPHRHQPGRRR